MLSFYLKKKIWLDNLEELFFENKIISILLVMATELGQVGYGSDQLSININLIYLLNKLKFKSKYNLFY